MNVNCVGFYYIKDSTSNQKKETKWIKANLEINAHVDRYLLQTDPILDDEDIYDEDEDERSQKLPRIIKLSDYKTCERRGSQKYNNFTIHLLALHPKLFTKAKKLYLAFFDEDVLSNWHQNLDTILTNKFHRASSMILSSQIDSHTAHSIDQFMIENDIYEGTLQPGEFYASVIDCIKSKEINIKGRYILVVTDIGIELRDEYNKKFVKLWEIKNMRRFGENENVFFMELGKYCADGQGILSFKVDKGKLLLKELLQMKDNFMKNKANKKSSVKQNDDEIFSSSCSKQDNQVTSQIRETTNSNMCENKLYITRESLSEEIYVENEISRESKNVMTISGPPKVAPPPIPSENPK